MKRKLTCLLFAVFALFCVFAAACSASGVSSEENRVVITVQNASDGQTLKGYMDGLEESGELTFTISDGLVTSINGKSNFLNGYWMLYTDDTEYSDAGWGSLEYQGKTYYSATRGAAELPVKNGCIYIWEYQIF